ncbi:hypothetical protein [Streptomyces mayteni]
MGTAGAKVPGARFVAAIDGTYEDAHAALWEYARGHRPEHPKAVVAQRVIRQSDGFLVIDSGATGTDHPCRFRVAELLWDSAVQGPGS